MKSFKLTSQQVHQVEDQALNDTYSDTHLTHQSQVPGKQATKIHAEILLGKEKYYTRKYIFSSVPSTVGAFHNNSNISTEKIVNSSNKHSSY